MKDQSQRLTIADLFIFVMLTIAVVFTLVRAARADEDNKTEQALLKQPRRLYAGVLPRQPFEEIAMAELNGTKRSNGVKDETGNRYGRLVVVGRAEANKWGAYRWKCVCDCGGETIALTTSLRRGHSKSCGCLQLEKVRTHGLTDTPEYASWYGMKNRCTCKTSKYYSRYGGRGITMCDRWRESFLNFLDDMGPRPSPQHSLDRIDNNGSYEPSNCRWATKSEQARNRRSNRIVFFDGREMCVAELLKTMGIKSTTVYDRLSKGMSVHDAISPFVNGGSQLSIADKRHEP